MLLGKVSWAALLSAGRSREEQNSPFSRSWWDVGITCISRHHREQESVPPRGSREHFDLVERDSFLMVLTIGSCQYSCIIRGCVNLHLLKINNSEEVDSCKPLPLGSRYCRTQYDGITKAVIDVCCCTITVSFITLDSATEKLSIHIWAQLCICSSHSWARLVEDVLLATSHLSGWALFSVSLCWLLHCIAGAIWMLTGPLC